MASQKRVSGAKGLRPLVVDLEDLLTPAIVDEIGSNSKLSNVLTGDYNLDADSSKKTTTITFFAKTKDKAPREQVVKDILEVVEDNILEISHKDFNIEVIWDKDTKFTTGFLGVNIKDGDVVKHKLKYGIKPEAGAKASLYEVTAQECLQAVGCAYLQENNSIDVDDFFGFLSYAHEIAIKNGSTKENDAKWGTALKAVEKYTDFGDKVEKQRADVYAFGIGDKDWVQSTVSCAKALKSKFNGGTYTFCYPAADMMKWWAPTYKAAKEQVLKKNGVFADEGINAGMLDINKWNPADIFAVKSTFHTPIFTDLKIDNRNETQQVTPSALSYHMKDLTNGKRSGVINIGDKIKKDAENASTVEGLPSLNQWLLNQVNNGNLYPISLKKAGKSANVTIINDSEHDVTMEATLESVEWRDDFRGRATNKVEVHFKIDVDGKEKDYFINARQFNEGQDIKLQIEQVGALAFHGKVGLSIASLIINHTDHRIKQKLINVRNMKKLKDAGMKNSNKLFSSVNGIEGIWRDTKDEDGMSQVLLDYVGFLSKKGVTKIPKTGSGHVSKVQATEFGYIIKRAEANNLVSEILYALFTFAGSRGLVLFDKKDFKNHFASSVHLKVQ